MESLENFIKRELRNSLENQSEEKYLVKVTFSTSINEHKQIQNFKNSSNRFLYHSEQTHPPVKAHYHIVPRNGKNEIYAVNLDGTAHHKKNKGYVVPSKEAKELRNMGVDLNPDNILEIYAGETKELLIEEKENIGSCIFILID